MVTIAPIDHRPRFAGPAARLYSGPEPETPTAIFGARRKCLSALAALPISAARANPGNLHSGGYKTPPFVATETFSADAQGSVDNGVNTNSDIVGVVLGVGELVDFATAAAAVGDGRLRFGLHVRSIGAYSFVNEVPLPAAVLLFGSALLGFAVASRRKANC